MGDSNPKPEIAEKTECVDSIDLRELAVGTRLEIQTRHRHYTIEKCDGTRALISGHPTFCPQPVEVEIEGSIGKLGLNPKPGRIERGTYLIFKHPELDRVITTSEIREIHRIPLQ